MTIERVRTMRGLSVRLAIALTLPAALSRKPMLQGWAIVDNTVGEDWENVELSLVAGQM